MRDLGVKLDAIKISLAILESVDRVIGFRGHHKPAGQARHVIAVA